MKDKKLQIFVSSTYTDLKEERQAAVEAILSSGHIPAGMELFSAGDESQMSVIKRWIDESDVYLLILGGRYGSIDKISGKSYTHLEFEYALEKGKPLFAIVISEVALDNKVKTLGGSAIEQENAKELKEFKSIVLNNLVKFWDDKKDIKIAIHETVSDFSYRKDLIGWIRGDNSINTGFLAEEIARLTKENSELRNRISTNESSNNALYANLTFSQLEELLKRESITLEKINYNLFDFLLIIGETVSKKLVVEKERKEGLEKLALYKLVSQATTNGTQSRFVFTEEGHNFYLKALLLSNQNSLT